MRASTAAPTYFPPEVVRVGGHEFVFVDGGVTTYNNPAFLLFLMATIEPYRLGWRAGEKDMLVVSIGTGTSPKANVDLGPDEMNLLYNAGSIPSALMYAALNEQDMLCRVFGRCVAGDPLDREVGDLCGVKGPVDAPLVFVGYGLSIPEVGHDDMCSVCEGGQHSRVLARTLGETVEENDRSPVARLDHIFLSPHFTVLGVESPRTHLTQVASDHFPLVADLCWPKDGAS